MVTQFWGILNTECQKILRGKKNNLMLHAYKINFSIAGTKYNFSAEPPPAFKNIVREKHLRTF